MIEGNGLRLLILIAMIFTFAAGALVLQSCTQVGNDDDDDDDDDDSEGDDDSADDDDDDSGDDDDDGGMTIYDIQQGKVTEGTIVTLNGVIATSQVSEENTAFFVQEPDGGQWSGIYVYVYDEVVEKVADLEPGDIVNLTGEYTEFFEMSEITVTSANDIEITGFEDAPDPEVVSPADVANGGSLAENYESVLIQVNDVTVTNPDLGHNDFEVTGGLIVDDFFYYREPADGETFTSIAGPLNYSFDNFMIEPRDADDYNGSGGGDDDDDDDDDDTTIYDIQQGNVTPDTTVTLSGVIATTPLTSGGQGFFVQEPGGGEYSGIYVFVFHPGSKALDIEPGDVVTLTGTYVEYGDKDTTLSEITVENGSDVSVTGTDTVPTPILVDQADIATGGSKMEEYEGVLLKVEDVTVTNDDLGFGEWEVTDGLRIDNLFFSPTIVNGTDYASITGCLYYSFDHSKLEPRTTADLVED